MWTQRFLPAAIGLLIMLALAGLRAADPAPLGGLREAGFSLLERLAPRQPLTDSPVMRVEIDAASSAEAGPWPWPRDRLAQLVQRLDELGASVVALDLDLSSPDPLSPSRLAGLVPELDPAVLPDTDTVLATAMAASPVILGLQPIPDGPALRLPADIGVPLGSDAALADLPTLEAARLPERRLLAAAAGLGVAGPTEAGSGRDLPLLWKQGDKALPALALAALRLAEGGAPVTLPRLSQEESSDPVITVGRYRVPVSVDGRLRLYKPPAGSDATLSARDILGVGYRRLAPQVEGRILLVGLASDKTRLELEAQAIEQIVSGSFLVRPDWSRSLELGGFALFALLTLAAALAFGPLAGIGAALAGGAALVTAAWLGFVTQGLLLDLTFPMLGLVAVLLFGMLLFVTMVDGPRRRLRALFAGRLSPQGLLRLAARPERVQLMGEQRQTTVLAARLIPPSASENAPQQRLRELNIRLVRMTQPVLASEGLVESASGDRLVALWNAPLETTDPARKAALAALAMRQAGPMLAGLATGNLLLGRLGVSAEPHYGALGEALDRAERLQRTATLLGYDLVLGEELRAVLEDFALLEAGRPPLGEGGRHEALHLLVGDAAMAETGAFRLLALAHGETLRLLRDGADASGGIFECRSLAEKLEPGLVRFYERLAPRRPDFL